MSDGLPPKHRSTEAHRSPGDSWRLDLPWVLDLGAWSSPFGFGISTCWRRGPIYALSESHDWPPAAFGPSPDQGPLADSVHPGPSLRHQIHQPFALAWRLWR